MAVPAAVNNGIQCFGLMVSIPLPLTFMSVRHVLLLSLFMAPVSWNGHAFVTDVLQTVVCSILSPANAVYFSVVRTGRSNTFGDARGGRSKLLASVNSRSTGGARHASPQKSMKKGRWPTGAF